MSLTAVLLLGLAPVLAAPSASAPPVVPEPLPVRESAPVWDGPQFVQADQAGRVFFFRGNTLEVYPLTREGGFGKPFPLETTGENVGLTHRAALSPHGDQWLLYTDHAVRLFSGGKEKPVPDLDWSPWTVGFLRDTPVVAVIPRPRGRERDLSTPVDLPWFLKLSGDRWSPVTALKQVSVAKMMKDGGMNGAIAENAVFLKSDRDGKLWAARQYAYHVQRFGPTGRVLIDLTVDGGKVQDEQQEPKGIEIKPHGANDNPTEATRNPRAEKATFFAFTAQPAILDLAEGLDGRFYFLVNLPSGGTALDRFDPGRAVLERVHLRLNMKGTFTIASGKDALYMAAYQGRDGRWRISWDTLDQAHWKPVGGAEIDGSPVSPAGSR
jgi:hypothetical protein